MRTVVTGLLLVFAGVLLASCSEEPPAQPPLGTVSVQVVDISSDQPVASVEIKIAGTNLVSETDDNGIAVFEIAAGDYFVDARVCCIGPGFIEHHVGIAVAGGQQVEVPLHACFACL